MSIPVKCECGFANKVPDEWAGKRVKCKCGRKIAVPGAAPAGKQPSEAKSPAAKTSQESKSSRSKPPGKQQLVNAGKKAEKKAEKKVNPKAEKKIEKKAAPTTSRKAAIGEANEDLSDLASDSLPKRKSATASETSKPRPATKSEPVEDSVEELDELDNLDEFGDMREEPAGSALDDINELEEVDELREIDELQELDDFDSLDMKEAESDDLDDELNMSESVEEKPAVEKPIARKFEPKSAPAHKPAPSSKTAPSSKPVSAAKPTQPAKPVVTEPEPKKKSATDSKAKAKAKVKGAQKTQKKTSNPVPPNAASADVQPASEADPIPAAEETVAKAKTSLEESVSETGPFTATESAPVSKRNDAPPPPDHAPKMPHSDAGEVSISIGDDKPVVVNSVAPKLAVGGASSASLTRLQQAKRKSDFTRIIISAVVLTICILAFGGVFLVGVMLNRFEDPKKAAKPGEEKVEQVETMEVPGGGVAPTAVPTPDIELPNDDQASDQPVD